MALVVEDGTGLANAESYLSLAEADAYHTAIGNQTTWTGTDADLEILLRRATAYMERAYVARWKGFRTYADRQALSWPRQNVFIDYGSDGAPDQPNVDVTGGIYRVYRSGLVWLPSNVVPTAVKNATAEVALTLLQGVRLEMHPSQPAAVRHKSVRASSVAVDTSYADTSNTIVRFEAVEGMLFGLIRAQSSYFGSVVRG